MVVQATALVVLGDYAFGETWVEELILPPSLKRVGRGFLYGCRATTLHVVADGLEEVGEGFMEGVSVPKDSIIVPPCLQGLLQRKEAFEEE